MTPEERARYYCNKYSITATSELVTILKATRREAYEQAVRVAEKRRDTWRAEADTYSEADQAKFVRNIRAGEAQNIAVALRRLSSEGE